MKLIERIGKFKYIALLVIFFIAFGTVISVVEFFIVPDNAEVSEVYRRLIQGWGLNVIFNFALILSLIGLNRKFRPVFIYLILMINALFLLLSIFNLTVYEQLPSTTTLVVMLDTNLAEASEYVKFYATAKNILMLILGFVVVGYLFIIFSRLLKKCNESNVPSWIAATSFFCCLFLFKVGSDKVYFMHDNPIAFFLGAGGDALSTVREYDELSSFKPRKSNARLELMTKPTTHIVVIGESATSKHMSLYDYERETNPKLKKLNHNYILYLSKDTCSSKPATYASIESIMLGGSGPLKLSADGHYDSHLVSIIQDAGYKIDWISNQPRGGFGGMLKFWSKSVDHLVFTNNRDYRVGNDFDEAVLPELKKSLENNTASKVVFIHLMGSHPGYKHRYPAHFQNWQMDDQVPASVARRGDFGFNRDSYNAYDNSMLYTDHVLSEIIKIADENDVSTITYFSDHGQNLGANNNVIGHSTEQGPKQGYEVPLLFWVNRNVERIATSNFVNFEQNLLKKYSLDRLQHTLFDLLGIRVHHYRDEDSLFNKSYLVKKRVCDNFD